MDAISTNWNDDQIERVKELAALTKQVRDLVEDYQYTIMPDWDGGAAKDSMVAVARFTQFKAMALLGSIPA